MVQVRQKAGSSVTFVAGPDLDAWEAAIHELGGESGSDALTTREICVKLLGKHETESGIRATRLKIKQWEEAGIIVPTQKMVRNIGDVLGPILAYRLVRNCSTGSQCDGDEAN